MIFIFRFLLLFTLVTGVSFSQKQQVTVAYIDSLVEEVSNLSELNFDDFAITDSLCKLIDSKSKSINYYEGSFISYLILAETYRNFSLDKTNSLTIKMDSLMSLNKIKNSMLLIRYHLIKGYLEGSKGNFLNEITQYLKADSVAIANHEDEARRYINQNICGYYMTNNEYDKAIVLARENVFNSSKDSLAYFVDIENLAILHSYINNYDSTIFYLNKIINEGYGNFVICIMSIFL